MMIGSNNLETNHEGIYLTFLPPTSTFQRKNSPIAMEKNVQNIYKSILKGTVVRKFARI